MKPSLLIIGHTIPEPSTTAAGNRMMQLISLFSEAEYQIVFASTASSTEYSEKLPFEIKSITLNDSSFDEFVKELNPSVVLFDRYITEEQFGWRVAENCPNALRILDTEDLHFLRKAREDAFKKGREINLYSDTAKRELATILRSDISLIISEAEMRLLKDTFQVPSGLMYYLPFLIEHGSTASPSFGERQHFITIGNFQHAPNVDAVVFLKKEIWPQIKEQLPEAQLHIYGAYAPKHISEMYDEKEGFLIKGWAENLQQTMQQARVCLAPLRFGAGLKGKIFDAARFGTPVVTTLIGGEGMFGLGIVKESFSAFVEASVTLYSQKDSWEEQQQKAFQILDSNFKRALFSEAFVQKIVGLQKEILNHRNFHFIGQILQHQSLQATKYMSKWIEEKNKKVN